MKTQIIPMEIFVDEITGNSACEFGKWYAYDAEIFRTLRLKTIMEMITRQNKSKFCNMFLKYRDFFRISIFKFVLKLNEQTKRSIKYITKIHN